MYIHSFRYPASQVPETPNLPTKIIPTKICWAYHGLGVWVGGWGFGCPGLGPISLYAKIIPAKIC